VFFSILFQHFFTTFRSGGAGEEAAAEDVFKAACHTMLTQRHLCPFPLTVQPVHWEYDGCLALFPQPDALVVPYEALLYNTEIHGVRYAAALADDAWASCMRTQTRFIPCEL
jgi:hypothetical protein